MPSGKKWLECCEHSISAMSALGHDFINRSRTMSGRHLLHRRKKECFPNLSSPRISKKQKDPPMFCKNPNFKKNFMKFCKMNLNQLSFDLVKDFFGERGNAKNFKRASRET